MDIKLKLLASSPDDVNRETTRGRGVNLSIDDLLSYKLVEGEGDLNVNTVDGKGDEEDDSGSDEERMQTRRPRGGTRLGIPIQAKERGVCIKQW